MTNATLFTRKITTKMQIANEYRANRMRQAWTVAKSLGLKRLTKDCFGVQTPPNKMENTTFKSVQEFHAFCSAQIDEAIKLASNEIEAKLVEEQWSRTPHADYHRTFDADLNEIYLTPPSYKAEIIIDKVRWDNSFSLAMSRLDKEGKLYA